MSDESSGKTPRSAPSPRENGGEDEGSIFHRVRSDVLKKKVEAMLKEGVIKNLVSELKLPREIVTHLMTQIDETKQAALGVVSREVRLFFENTNLSEELTRVLSQLSFEITTRVRFVRNEDAVQKTTKGARDRDTAAVNRAGDERISPGEAAPTQSKNASESKPASPKKARGENGASETDTRHSETETGAGKRTESAPDSEQMNDT